MPTAEKAMKERDRTQMPVAKKERTDHKCLWQRKKEQTTNAGGKRKNVFPNQTSKQLTQNERNKTAETTSKPPNGCLPASIRWREKQNKTKNPTKSQQSNRLLSAAKEWMTTVIRAQSKNTCANDKQMESQTFHS